MKKALLLILFLTCSNIYADDTPTEIEIIGAFGYKLGEIYKIRPNQMVMMYKLKNVRKPFRKFNSYDISVDKQQQIFLIRAEFYAKTENEAIRETTIITKIIATKYKAIPQKVNPKEDIYFVGIKNHTQKRSIGIVRDGKTVRIMYRDSKIGDQAAKEHREEEQQKIFEEAKEIL